VRDCIFLSPKKEVVIKNTETPNDFTHFKLAAVHVIVNFFLLPNMAAMHVNFEGENSPPIRYMGGFIKSGLNLVFFVNEI
jgi:hypothetical protein